LAEDQGEGKVLALERLCVIGFSDKLPMIASKPKNPILMRKISFATLALALGLSFGSCSKEYNCDCETTTDDGQQSTENTYTKEFKKESDAEDWCSDQESETTTNGVTSTTECELSEQ
jgi:hypothetical protein